MTDAVGFSEARMQLVASSCVRTWAKPRSYYDCKLASSSFQADMEVRVASM